MHIKPLLEISLHVLVPYHITNTNDHLCATIATKYKFSTAYVLNLYYRVSHNYWHLKLLSFIKYTMQFSMYVIFLKKCIIIVDCHLEAHLLKVLSIMIDPYQKNLEFGIMIGIFSKNRSKLSPCRNHPHSISLNEQIDHSNGVLLLSW